MQFLQFTGCVLMILLYDNNGILCIYHENVSCRWWLSVAVKDGRIVGNSVVVKLTTRVDGRTPSCKERSCRGYNIHPSEGPPANDTNVIGKLCQVSVDRPDCLLCLPHDHRLVFPADPTIRNYIYQVCKSFPVSYMGTEFKLLYSSYPGRGTI